MYKGSVVVSLFENGKENIRVQLIDCDNAPKDMKKQLPIVCSLLRMIPGIDRPDYWLAKCERPLKDKKTIINYLIIAPRLVGEQIKKGMGSIGINVAYVIDETLLQDSTLNFDKCKPVAICTSEEF